MSTLAPAAPRGMKRHHGKLYVPFDQPLSIFNIADLIAHHREQFTADAVMDITAAEMVLRLSVAAAAGDTTAGTPATSLGDQVSTTAVGTAVNDLFDNISGAENAAATQDFRGLFLLNTDAALTASNISLFLNSEVAGGASVALATDNIAASAKGSGSTQMATIANETTAPTGVSAFSSPTTDGTGLSLGTLTSNQVKGLWVRRTAANSAALTGDGFTFGISFDSPA